MTTMMEMMTVFIVNIREIDMIIAASSIAWIVLFILFLSGSNNVRISRNKQLEWWYNNKDSRYHNLILPPLSIMKQTAAHEKKSNFSFMEKPKILMKKLFHVPSKSWLNSNSWTIDLSNITPDISPLICFINVKSGGQQGTFALKELQKLLNPLQVVDISKVDPLVVILKFSKLIKWKVLVCGGDGTVGWILNILDKLPPELFRPSIAILPIGTGNDLSRELGWGPGHSSHAESLKLLLNKISVSQYVDLDRWEATISTIDNNKPPIKQYFQNYCGFGVDAQIVLNFHLMRLQAPHRFFSRLVNKFWYGLMGWQEIWDPQCIGFYTKASLYQLVDGKRIQVEIPGDCEGIVLLNVSSYGGGSQLWCEDEVDATDDNNDEEEYESLYNDGKKKWKPVSYNDGLLEVVAVKSSFELAQVKLGISGCLKLAQAESFELHIHSPLPLQFDGEPRIQNPSIIQFKVCDRKAIMLRGVEEGSQTEVIAQVLNWAEQTNVITIDQQRIIFDEYIKVIEKKQNEEWTIQ
eukprot:gene4856-6806_t